MKRSSQNLLSVTGSYRGDNSHTTCLLPALYIIEPTNVCNYRCIMCPNQFYEKDQKGYMDWKLYTSIIDQIANIARAVQFYWVGESLFHPRLPDMIAYLKQHSDANTILSTNGSLITETKSRELINSGLDELIIALDANTRKTYEKIRVLGDWETVLKNVESFFTIMGKRKRPRTILQLIKMRENKSETEDFIQRWSKYPCEPIITWLDTWANQFPSMSNWSDYLCPNSSRNRRPCAEIWYKMVVNWQGRVTICCHDWAWKNVIGDLTKQTVEQVWNSHIINTYRRFHQQANFEAISICKNCPEWSTEEDQYEFFRLSKKEQSQLNMSFSYKSKT